VSFRFVSSAVDNAGFLPSWYSRLRNDSSPPAGWAEAPEGTKSIVIICEQISGETRICHWVLFNVPPEPTTIYGGLPKEPDLPRGAVHGTNSFGVPGWTGPGFASEGIVLVFTGYALSSLLPLPSGASVEAVRTAMQGRLLARCEFSGRYVSRQSFVELLEGAEER
jgi:Raf kinase inhibitor-like YbhB/YbcL family protein